MGFRLILTSDTLIKVQGVPRSALMRMHRPGKGTRCACAMRYHVTMGNSLGASDMQLLDAVSAEIITELELDSVKVSIESHWFKS